MECLDKMTVKARYKLYFHLDDGLFVDDATKNQLYYAYSAAASVASVPMGQEFADRGRRAIMVLRGMILNHPFWFSDQAEADSLWSGTLIPQLGPTVERAIQLQELYQRKSDKIGMPIDYFDRLELVLDPYRLSFQEPRQLDWRFVVEAVETTRRLLNADVFNRGMLEHIDIPCIETKPDLGADPAVEPLAEPLAEPTVELSPEPPSKQIDYSIWQVFYKDGSSKLFDSVAEDWLAQPVQASSLAPIAT
jgi:hypothetical protein